MDKALEELTAAPEGSRDKAVHEARKSFKKARAVLRLVRPVIGRKTYRAENTCFRDAGRPLTEVRDAKVLVETLDKFAELKAHVGDRPFGEVREALEANLQAVRRRVLDEGCASAVVAEAVREARGRVKGWTDVPNRWSSVGKGLEGAYRRAREASEGAAADPTVEKLHEWRKQAKYLRYQLQILRPLWPERMEELVDEADRMGELLGGDHDLAVLRQALGDAPWRLAEAGDVGVMQALIDRRRCELQQEALGLGERFFQDSPGDFARRLKRYWKAWRARAGGGRPDEPPVALAQPAAAEG
jgi:CHAD domain-containing protein